MKLLFAKKTQTISMSTKTSSSRLKQALSDVKEPFRTKLIDAYLSLKRSQLEANYEAAGIRCGKFCEVLVRLLQEEITGSHTAFGNRIPDMANECRNLITAQCSAVPESLKIIVPRALIFLYTMRNKRGIGHIGGDIDANSIDLATIERVTDWILCELIRVYHKLPIEEAQELIDSLAVRKLPVIWEVAGKKRVLRKRLSSKQKVLVILYSQPDTAILTEDLRSWVEYSNPTNFVNLVLTDLHQKRLIEYDKQSELVYLSPSGAKLVEDEILKHEMP